MSFYVDIIGNELLLNVKYLIFYALRSLYSPIFDHFLSIK